MLILASNDMNVLHFIEKKKMKNYKILLASLLGAAGLFVLNSCSKKFLNEEQITIPDTDYFKTEKGLDDLSIGVYSKLKFKFNYTWAMGLFNLGVDEFTDAAGNGAGPHVDHRQGAVGVVGMAEVIGRRAGHGQGRESGEQQDRQAGQQRRKETGSDLGHWVPPFLPGFAGVPFVVGFGRFSSVRSAAACRCSWVMRALRIS